MATNTRRSFLGYAGAALIGPALAAAKPSMMEDAIAIHRLSHPQSFLKVAQFMGVQPVLDLKKGVVFHLGKRIIPAEQSEAIFMGEQVNVFAFGLRAIHIAPGMPGLLIPPSYQDVCRDWAANFILSRAPLQNLDLDDAPGHSPLFGLVRASNRIAKATRRGCGNVLVGDHAGFAILQQLANKKHWQTIQKRWRLILVKGLPVAPFVNSTKPFVLVGYNGGGRIEQHAYRPSPARVRAMAYDTGCIMAVKDLSHEYEWLATDGPVLQALLVDVGVSDYWRRIV